MPDIEELIRRAIAEGKFADLPGKGRPLRLDDDPHADPDWQLAYHLLRENGFTLPWLELRKEIESDWEQALGSARLAWEARRAALQRGRAAGSVEAEWQRSESEFRRQVEALNRRIFDYNLQTPAARFQMCRLDPEKELRRVRMSGEG